MTQAFGQIIHGAAVELAVVEHLRAWGTTYIAELERQTGRAERTLATFRSFQRHNSVDRWPEEQLPAVLCVCPGLSDQPKRAGSGEYTASWQVGVAVIAMAASRDGANDLAKLYGAAVRAIMVQKPQIGTLPVVAVTWTDERYDEFTDESSRALAAVYEVFDVQVRGVVDAHSGPVESDPQLDPYTSYPDDPIAATVAATYEPMQ